MACNSKHILILIKFHPERELRLIQEFCKDGYTYDVVAPSFRIAADWNSMIKKVDFQPAKKVFVIPELVAQIMHSGVVSDQQPNISNESYEKAIIVDKLISKWHSKAKVNLFLNCYLHIINNHLNLNCYYNIIGEISSAFEFILFKKVKSLQIPYTYFIASPISPNTFFFIDDQYQIKNLPEIYQSEKKLSEQLKNQHAEKRTEIKVPGYMQFNNQTSINNLIRSNKLTQGRTSRLFNFIKTYVPDSKLATDFVPGISFYIQRMAKLYRFMALKMFGKSLWKNQVKKDQYVLFLQYEPEITTSLYAYPFKSQREWIETVLNFMEDGKTLYIKEHPAMFSQRGISFYLFLKGQEKVQLVDPTVPSKLLMKDARAVFTLNSTVGIESLKCGTPIISFGNAYFNFLPQIIKWEEIKSNSSWKNFGDIVFPSKQELQQSYYYLEQSIKKVEYSGCLNDHRLDKFVMSVENMSRVKNAIEQYVGEN